MVQGFLLASFGSGLATLSIYLITTPNPTPAGALDALSFGFGVGGLIYGGLHGLTRLYRWARSVPAKGANAPEAARDSFGNVVDDPAEAAAMRRMLREGAKGIEHLPEGPGGPDFRVIGGPLAGPNGQAMVQVKLLARGDVHYRQLLGLLKYRDQGYGIAYYVGKADVRFTRLAAANEVPLFEIWG